MELAAADFAKLMAALGENTRTVIPFHFLRRERARAWADEDFANAVIQTGAADPMAFIFGEEANWQAEVVATLRPQRLYWCPDSTVAALLPVVDNKHENDLILEPDIQRTVAEYVHIPPPEGAEIRRMTAADLPVITTCSPEVAWLRNAWDSWEELLEKGLLIAALADGRMVSGALTYARAEVLDDIGVATESAYQRRGLSSACTSALVREIFDEGRRPLWTVFVSNTPSVRISDKLGFMTQTQCTVIRAQYEHENS